MPDNHSKGIKFLTICTMLTLNVNFKANAKPRIAFYDIFCAKSDKTIREMNCHTTNKNNRSTATIQVYFSQDIKQLAVRVQVTALINGRTTLNLYDVNIDLCEICGSKEPRRNLLKIFHQVFQAAATDFPKKCPFKKDTLYALKDLLIDHKLIPMYLPQVDFVATIQILGDKRMIGNLELNGTVCRGDNNDVLLCRL